MAQNLQQVAKLTPPYGDGTNMYNLTKSPDRFSPPYGDGMEAGGVDDDAKLFSPPYGDGILNISQNIAKLNS